MNDVPHPDNYYHRIQRGEIPPPPCSAVLGSVSVTADPAALTAETVYDAPETLLNPIGSIQGGFLTAMLDDTMSTAIVAALPVGEGAPSLSITIQFHAPARPGRLVARARVTMRGRSICHMAGELEQGGRVVASATATAAIRRLPGGS